MGGGAISGEHKTTQKNPKRPEAILPFDPAAALPPPYHKRKQPPPEDDSPVSSLFCSQAAAPLEEEKKTKAFPSLQPQNKQKRTGPDFPFLLLHQRPNQVPLFIRPIIAVAKTAATTPLFLCFSSPKPFPCFVIFAPKASRSRPSSGRRSPSRPREHRRPPTQEASPTAVPFFLRPNTAAAPLSSSQSSLSSTATAATTTRQRQQTGSPLVIRRPPEVKETKT